MANFQLHLPDIARRVANVLLAHGGEAYVVGGFVRDAIRGVDAHDCDIATDILPHIGKSLFIGPDLVAIDTGMKFGTFTVISRLRPDEVGVEVTTYRTDGRYTDGRRPDDVSYASTITEDLSRRDFTINAIAYNVATGELFDPYDGATDIRLGIIRCVGVASDRITEDPLRMMRAVRFIATLGYSLSDGVRNAIYTHAARLRTVSRERVGEELRKLLVGDAIWASLATIMNTGLMQHLIPELVRLDRFQQQNPHHRYDAWEHTLLCVSRAEPTVLMRMAALMHDVAKPACRTMGSDGVAHYYGHDEAGAVITSAVCRRLCFPNTPESGHLRDTIVTLVRNHMSAMHSDHSDRTIRRFVARVGKAMALDIIRLQQADLLATGTRLLIDVLRDTEELLRRIERIADEQPCQTAQLAITGHDVMRIADIATGPLVGEILAHLHDRVLDDPSRNTVEALSEDVRTFVLTRQHERCTILSPA